MSIPAPEVPRVSAKMRRLVGKAIFRYDMIVPGDRIAVGVSGGKDSLTLLYILKDIKAYSPVKYDLQAVSVDMTGGAWDAGGVKAVCDALEVPLAVVPFNIEHVIEQKKEASPCSLCANLRRGLLNAAAKKRGCNKLALGHNLDDAVETALMNLFRNGRFRAFQPKLWHDRADVWLIRPMIYLTERQIAREIERLGVKTSQHCCAYAGRTERARAKELVSGLSARFPDVRRCVLHALEGHRPEDSWTATPRLYFGVHTSPSASDALNSAPPLSGGGSR